MLEKEDYTNQFVRTLPFFKGLPDAALDAFLNSIKVKSYPKSRIVFYQGDKADRFFIVFSGWVKLFRNTEEGDEAVIALFTRGDVFGEAAVFDSADYPFSAQAAEETRLIEISAALLKEQAKKTPEIMARVMHSMSHEMHKLQMENEHMAIMSTPQRVGCLLLQLSSGMAGKGGTFSFPYDKSLAAARLGMTPETFSRALAQLRLAGVSSKRGEIHVENFCRLAGHCCSHCSAELKDCNGAARKATDENLCPRKSARAGQA